VASDTAESLLRRQFQGAVRDGEGQGLAEEFQSLSDALAKVAHRETSLSKPSAPITAAPVAPEPVSAAATAATKVPATSSNMATLQLNRTAPFETDPTLLEHLAAAVTACRQSRRSLSLLLVELDNPEELMARYGADRLGNLRRFVEAACRKVECPGARCLPYGEMAFAVILPGCDRPSAVQSGNELVDQIRHLSPPHSETGRSTVSVSVGVATVALPPKNFPHRDLLEAASRCLYGAHTSGGTLKSIEIY